MPDRPPLSAWERHLCAPVAGRKVICAFEVLAGLTRMVPRLRRWQAQRPLLLADGVGTGPVPSADEAEVEILTPAPFDTLTEQVRGRTRPRSRLTPAAIAAVDGYDPDRSAVWWMSPVTPNADLLGRKVLGGRPASQAALENKLLLDEMLDAASAVRPASASCAASYDALMTATDDVLARSGADEVVWAGDNRDGINGGADYVRWIRTSEHATAAADFFAANCAKVRVNPFLEGVPCSIHAIVLPDGVVVLRPMELISLRRPDDGRFVYAGMGTSWDPAPADTDEMRTLARALGTHLQRTYGYRGGFGVDGVITADGFVATELNPRFSGGLTRFAAVAPDAQLELVQINALLGRDVARPAVEIEQTALEQLEACRFVDVVGMSGTPAPETVHLRVRAGRRRLGVAAAEHRGVGSVQWGPSGNGVGSFVRLAIDSDVVERGDRCAPYGVLLYEFADRMWGTGFGAVAMPHDVRGRPHDG
jgi:hypothetical protein